MDKMIRVYKKSEIAVKMGVCTQRVSQLIKSKSSRLNGLYILKIYRGKGRGITSYSMIFFSEDKTGVRILQYFYKLGLNNYMAFTTFRDLFNELLERGYDLKRFIEDYDVRTILNLLGYDGDIDEWKWKREFAHLLFACLVYAFSLKENVENRVVEVESP